MTRPGAAPADTGPPRYRLGDGGQPEPIVNRDHNRVYGQTLEQLRPTVGRLCRSCSPAATGRSR